MLPLSEHDSAICRLIRVLVVDEHAAVRHAMASLITSLDDMELAGEAATGEEALRLCACSQPDVVLMAITIHGTSAAEATRAIKKRWPPIQVLGMSTFQEEDQVPGVLQAGATGYMLKNVTAEELACAIRKVYAAPCPALPPTGTEPLPQALGRSQSQGVASVYSGSPGRAR